MGEYKKCVTAITDILNKIVDKQVMYGDAPETLAEVIDYIAFLRTDSEYGEYDRIIKEISELG